MWPKSLVRTGFVILTIAILLPSGTGYWLKTRRFKPVDMPVSLLVGRIQTIEFETNLRGDYFVDFEADYDIYYRVVEPCPTTAWRSLDWTLYRLGGDAPNERVLWATNNNFWAFRGPPGKYQLDWNISAEGECLNSGHPRLEIHTSSDMYELVDSFLLFLSVFFGGAGAMLVLRGLGSLLWGRLVKTRTLRMLPELTVRNVLPARKRNPARPIAPMTQLSIFSQMWGSVLSILVMLFMIYPHPLMRHGLFVKIHERGGTAWHNSPWPQTMSVYVGSDGRYYVNGQSVMLDGLRSKLKDELAKQMVWTVYLEADQSIQFAKVVYAMDAIQQEGGKVVWITPKIREELNRRTSRDASPQFLSRE